MLGGGFGGRGARGGGRGGSFGGRGPQDFGPPEFVIIILCLFIEFFIIECFESNATDKRY